MKRGIQERREAGRRDSGLEGYRKGGIWDCKDPVLKGHRKRGIRKMRDTGLEGFRTRGLQDSRENEHEGSNRGDEEQERCRTGGI